MSQSQKQSATPSVSSVAGRPYQLTVEAGLNDQALSREKLFYLGQTGRETG